MIYFALIFGEKSLEVIKPLSANPTKMVRHTQTIGRLLPKNCLSVLDHFLELALEKLKAYFSYSCH